MAGADLERTRKFWDKYSTRYGRNIQRSRLGWIERLVAVKPTG